MEWLSDWIKQIILLVLIATFIDLLLPNPSMDRYVKLVMGLLIIMAILTPIFEVLHVSSLPFWKVNDAQIQTAMKSLDEIHGQSGEMQKKQQAQIHQQWEKNMEEWMNKHLIERFSLSEVQVKVVAQMDEEREPEIEEVQVNVLKIQESGKFEEIPAVSPIFPVERDREERAIQTQSEKHIEIKKYIANTWHLSEEKITIQMDEGVR